MRIQKRIIKYAVVFICGIVGLGTIGIPMYALIAKSPATEQSAR